MNVMAAIMSAFSLFASRALNVWECTGVGHTSCGRIAAAPGAFHSNPEPFMTPIHAGDQLDHYKIEELIARSGMASIYRGTDSRTGKKVAIKIPHPEMECDPIFFERFKRETDIGARLDHPGVMKVLVDDDRSSVYMVMEWVDGQLLRRVMSGRKLPPERAVKITLRILDALGYIHAHGVVHRDLKPENIMVDADDNIKLIDFGIAA